MRKINKVIVHCSDSKFGNAAMIRRWHLERGWSDIGYHFVILNGIINKYTYRKSLDGSIEVGRDEKVVGAHARGENSDSLGVCLIGKDNFSKAQIEALKALLVELKEEYELSNEDIYGHNELSIKSCPNFNVKSFLEREGI